MPRLTHEQRQEALARFAAGEGPAQIAADYGVTGPAISALAKKAGLPPKPRGRKGADEETRKKIIEDYAGDTPVDAIAEKWGVSRSTVLNYVDAAGVPRRYDTSKGPRDPRLVPYGLDNADYDRMLRNQGGVCAICGTLPPPLSLQNHRLVIDHCHKSGKVRGLLCRRCNIGLGNFEDDPDRLRKASSYLTLPRF